MALFKNHPLPVFKGWFVKQVKKILAKHFSEISLTGLEKPLKTLEKQSVIFLVNHQNFYDGLLLLLLAEHFFCHPWMVWMDGYRLRQLPFFSLLGAFGVRRQNPEEVQEAFDYIQQTLAQSPQIFFLFPQGRELPYNIEDWQFFQGSEKLSQAMPEVVFYPMLFRYSFEKQPLGLIHIYIGDALPAACPKEKQQEALSYCRLQAEQEALRRALLQPQKKQYQKLELSKPSALPWGTRFLSFCAAVYLKCLGRYPP